MSQERFTRLRDEARQRRQHAYEGAQRARERIKQLAEARSPWAVGEPAQAVERRILADERLAQVKASLAQARRRSVNAHERAARIDASVGKHTDATRHHEAADRDRQLIEDEAQDDGW